MRSVFLSSASMPANAYLRKSRNGRSRSVGARSLRIALSISTIFSPYSFSLAADQLVRTFQLVLRVERLVDLIVDRLFVVRIRARRIEVLGRALFERNEDRVGALGAQRMRVVRHLLAAGQRGQRPRRD